MVGSHMVDFLLENTDWEIHGICRWRSPMDNLGHRVSQINAGNRIFLHYGDICESNPINDIVEEIKPNYLFHLAAQSFPKTSFSSPLETYNTNVSGTHNVLEALRKYAPECVTHVCSSSEVFGRVSKEKLPIDENCSFHPASPYAISKVGTDLIGRYFAEAYSMPVMVTRMFTHTGPRRGDVFAESSFAKQIAMIEEGQIPPIVKVGNLNSLRTFADVRDAVRAYYLLVTVNPQPGECYNIGGSYTCTIKEMLDSLIKKSNVSNIKVQEQKDRLRPIDADLQVPDITKFAEHTGWAPEISFEQTMSDLLDFWRAKVKISRPLDR